MAYSAEKKRELLSLSLPESKAVREELQDYLDRSGLQPGDFARRIHYAEPSIRHFLSGTYEKIAGNDTALRKAALDFMTAHPVGAVEETQGKLYETDNVKLLRRYFYEALDKGRAVYVEGDPGTQKSFVLQRLVAELNRNELIKNGHGRRAYYVYCPQSVRRTQLLKLVAQACGGSSTGDVPRIIRNLRFDFRSRRVLLVFDEAQHLDVDCLETLRELHDLPPHFGLLFAGSHQLERMFARHALELEQWNSRFHAGKRLPGIGEDEAERIIRAELGARANAKVVATLVKGARARALASTGEHEYISARRLFNSLRELAGEEGGAQ